jgi:hypothetical protein
VQYADCCRISFERLIGKCINSEYGNFHLIILINLICKNSLWNFQEQGIGFFSYPRFVDKAKVQGGRPPCSDILNRCTNKKGGQFALNAFNNL